MRAACPSSQEITAFPSLSPSEADSSSPVHLTAVAPEEACAPASPLVAAEEEYAPAFALPEAVYAAAEADDSAAAPLAEADARFLEEVGRSGSLASLLLVAPSVGWAA
jgi:hypothetical protein